MLSRDIFGLPIPDAGPVFAVALAVHIAAGLTAVIAGALAATAMKRPGRHPKAGRAYLIALGFIFAKATVMSAIRWREDAHLFAIACVASGLGPVRLAGPAAAAARLADPARDRHGRLLHRLLTGFYVDNGPFLPIWDRLPHVTYWLLPSLVGVPLIWWALRRYHARDRAPVLRRCRPV